MNKEKLTDEQIIEALKMSCLCVSYGEYCNECPLVNDDECAENLLKAIPNLINRLKEENKKYERVTDTLNEQLKKENAELKAENERLKGKDSVVNTPTIQCETYSQNDMVVLSREEYEGLKRVENEKDSLYEIKLDLENQLIEKGWTDYEGADDIEKRVSKETAEKLIKFVSEHCDNEALGWLLDEFVAKSLGVEIKE